MIFLLVIATSFVGVALGTVTGLLPGVHVNNVALFMLSFSGTLAALLTVRDSGGEVAALLIANIILSTSITHTFVDFVPSTFFGAPDDETALSVLPAHRLLLKGEGHYAVVLSVTGSFIAVVICCLLALPFRFLVGDPLNGYALIGDNLLLALLLITGLMLFTEKSKGKGKAGRMKALAAALLVFCMSGLLGLIVLPMGVKSPFGLFSSPLFPPLSGLFGLSTLLLSLQQQPTIPAQRIETGRSFMKKLRSTDRPLSCCLRGTLAGSIVGFLPGVSAAHAAIIAGLGKGSRGKDKAGNSGNNGNGGNTGNAGNTGNTGNPGSAVNSGNAVNAGKDHADESSDERTIITLSSINTANSFFCLIALFIILKARNGAVLAAQRLIPVSRWSHGNTPEYLPLLLAGMLTAATAALFLTVRLGGFFAGKIDGIDYMKVVKCIVAFIVVMVFVFNGLTGLLILGVSTAIGMLAPWLEVRRSHAMGFLLLPVMISLAGFI